MDTQKGILISFQKISAKQDPLTTAIAVLSRIFILMYSYTLLYNVLKIYHCLFISFLKKQNKTKNNQEVLDPKKCDLFLCLQKPP